jgi:hypothetical protein
VPFVPYKRNNSEEVRPSGGDTEEDDPAGTEQAGGGVGASVSKLTKGIILTRSTW